MFGKLACRLPLSTTKATLISSPSILFSSTLKRASSSQPQNAATMNDTPKNASPQHPPSSCVEGTVLKGLGILQGKQDPVALKDSEYPGWLWSLLDNQKSNKKNITFKPEEKLSRQYIRHEIKEKIRVNAMKAKK